jgi:hypothetical protein
MYIRGGYYDGHEETWLDSVLLTEGNHETDAMMREFCLSDYLVYTSS